MQPLKTHKSAILLIILLVVISLVRIGAGQNNNSDNDNKSGVRKKIVEDEKSGENGIQFRDVSARNLRVVVVNNVDDAQQQAWRNNQENTEVRPQKRRRLRKRKRRPQIGENIDEQPLVRRRRPLRLEELESWKEMEAESPHRPYIRRRVGPVYQAEDLVNVPRPEQQPTIKDIKDILKQTDGLSLSEILQENNVTLADLLKGKQNAISALSERPLESITTTTDKEKLTPEEMQEREIKPRTTTSGEQVSKVEREREKLPEATNNERLNTNNNNNDEDKKINESKDILEQRKRLGLGQLYKEKNENQLYGEISTKFEVVTESTTEKRIFVPSHPKLYTSLNYKPEFEAQTEEPKRTTLRLPMTSAKLLNRKRTPSTTPQTTSKTTQTISQTPQTTQAVPKNKVLSGGPLKMSIDLDELTKQNTVIPEGPKLEQSTTMRLVETTISTTAEKITTTPPTTTTTTTTITTEEPLITTIETIQPVSEKLTTRQYVLRTGKLLTTIAPIPKKVTVISAKDEIMEILNNENGKDKLSKILTSRNMTIEELVEQRERGSSQRHLADIFHNDTKEPEAVLEHVGTINGTPTNKIQTQTLKTSTPVTTTTTTVKPAKIEDPIEIRPLEDVNMSSEEITISEKLPSTSFPTYKIETNKKGKEIPPLHIPIWKTIYPSIYVEPEDNNYKKARKYDLDEIEKSIRQAVDEDLNEISRVNGNSNFNDYDDSIQLPIGVKSAIFASLAIIGMSLVLFLTILVVFKWTQKHKKRLCYGGSNGSSITCSKIKSPILQQVSPTRTIRSFVSETLGKRRNFYAAQMRHHHHPPPHGVSDGWDSDRPYR